MARVLIVDDHLAVREGVRAMLETEPDLTVIGEAVDGVEAVSKALDLRPDLIVLDNSMPGLTGLQVARRIHPDLPNTAIVFLTLDPGIRDLAFASGATSVVLKDAPPEELVQAVRAAAATVGGARVATLERPRAAVTPIAPHAALRPIPSSHPAPPQRPAPERSTRRGVFILPAFLTQRRVAVALVIALLLFLSGIGAILNQAMRIETRGELTIFEGNVQLRHAGGDFAVAASGARVTQGDTVRTLAGSHAVLTFFDRSIVVFEPGTEVTIAELAPLNVVSMQLLLRQATGKTWHVIDHPLPSGARYVVETPTGTASVRGTAFQVAVTNDRSTEITTTEGVVATTGTGGATVNVSAGQATTVGASKTPASPVSAPIPTLTFVFESTSSAVVVDAAGRAAGVKDGTSVRYIPGSIVATRDSQLIVTVPGTDSGQFNSVIGAPAGAKTVDVHTDLRAASGAIVSTALESRAVDAGTAKGGVFLNGATVIAIGDDAARNVPIPIIGVVPPAPTQNPLIRIASVPLSAASPGPPGPGGAPGVAGPPGPEGPPGPTGAPGASGVGTNGTDGTTGVNGAPGANGLPGASGVPGTAGAGGAPGVPGANGATGLTGAAGATGPAGAAIEIGTCTEATASTAFSCAGAAVSGITLANLTSTDSIIVTQSSGNAGVGCFVGAIAPATPAFTINCSTKPQDGAVFNVMVVRH
jgi:DNA-binding NarL/FixJ family response regulator